MGWFKLSNRYYRETDTGCLLLRLDRIVDWRVAGLRYDPQGQLTAHELNKIKKQTISIRWDMVSVGCKGRSSPTKKT